MTFDSRFEIGNDYGSDDEQFLPFLIHKNNTLAMYYQRETNKSYKTRLIKVIKIFVYNKEKKNDGCVKIDFQKSLIFFAPKDI